MKKTFLQLLNCDDHQAVIRLPSINLSHRALAWQIHSVFTPASGSDTRKVEKWRPLEELEVPSCHCRWDMAAWLPPIDVVLGSDSICSWLIIKHLHYLKPAGLVKLALWVLHYVSVVSATLASDVTLKLSELTPILCRLVSAAILMFYCVFRQSGVRLNSLD